MNPRNTLSPLLGLLGTALVQFSGVAYHIPGRAYGSYVLYTGADGVTRLIGVIDPALNAGRVGDIGVQLTQLDDSAGGIYGNRTVGQLSWTGEKRWEWGTEAPGGAARQNHDWELLETAIASFSWRSRATFRVLDRTLSETRESTK